MEPYYFELINIPITNMGNACDMLCIDLGNVVRKNVLGDDLYEYSIHILAPWRIIDIRTGEVLIASNDMESWCNQHKSEKASEMFCPHGFKCNGKLITQISVSDYGDLKITFSNGQFLSTFNDTRSDECWRIIRRSEPDWHIVSYGKNIEIE